MTQVLEFAAPCELINAVSFVVPGEPASKARARFTKKGGTYTPAKTKAAEDAVGWAFRSAQPAGFVISSSDAFAVHATFYQATRQRRDVDNMIKLVLDGLNGVAWSDDNQVTEIHGRKILVPKGSARTEVVIGSLGLVDRGPVWKCARCGAETVLYESNAERNRVYCSATCRQAARTKNCRHCGETFYNPRSPTDYCSRDCSTEARTWVLTCIACGSEFRRARSLSVKGPALCSTECRDAHWTATKTANPKGTCRDCGGPTCRNVSARCRGCAIKHRRVEITPERAA